MGRFEKEVVDIGVGEIAEGTAGRDRWPLPSVDIVEEGRQAGPGLSGPKLDEAQGALVIEDDDENGAGRSAGRSGTERDETVSLKGKPTHHPHSLRFRK